jgi:hypothetical protein
VTVKFHLRYSCGTVDVNIKKTKTSDEENIWVCGDHVYRGQTCTSLWNTQFEGVNAWALFKAKKGKNQID